MRKICTSGIIPSQIQNKNREYKVEIYSHTRGIPSNYNFNFYQLLFIFRIPFVCYNTNVSVHQKLKDTHAQDPRRHHANTHQFHSPSGGCHQIVSLLQFGLIVTRHINTGSIAPHSHWQLRCVTNELQSVCPSDIAVSYYRITFSNLHVCLSMEFMA